MTNEQVLAESSTQTQSSEPTSSTSKPVAKNTIKITDKIEWENCGYKIIDKEHYEKLTQKTPEIVKIKSFWEWFRFVFGSPQFITALLFAIATYGWTLVNGFVESKINKRVDFIVSKKLQEVNQSSKKK